MLDFGGSGRVWLGWGGMVSGNLILFMGDASFGIGIGNCLF